MNAPLTLALAIVTTLLLLAHVAPGGALITGGTTLVLLLAAADATLTKRTSRPGSLAGSLLQLLPLILAGAVGLLSLLQLALSPTPIPGLAWFARVLCLASAAALFRTRPPALVLHGLTVLLGLWTASALQSRLEPLTAGGTLLALGLATHGLVLARARDLQAAAARSVTVGVAPTPWARRRSRGPALAVIALSLVPLALNVELPRIRRADRSGGASLPNDALPEAKTRGPLPRRVRFAPDLALDAGRDGLETPNERVALVTAAPEPTVLFLRGVALSQATASGFEIATRPPRDPRPSPTTQERRLDVDLLAPEHGFLFHVGRPLEWSGVDWRRDGEAFRAAAGTSYPLRYSVSCQISERSLDASAIRASQDPGLLALPEALKADPRLQALARELNVEPRAPQRAAAVMSWLARNARYDGAHPVPGQDLAGAVTTFLFESQRGICVEFAVSAAVLLRLVGVPTRVISGYRTHERDEGRFVVRSRHAHVWVEVAYDGAGWVPYDPTPAEPIAIGRSDAAPTRTAEATAARASASSPGPLGSSWLSLILALAALIGGAAWLLGRRRLAAYVRLAHLTRDAVDSAELTGDRERFFTLLEARGFDLEGALTPNEWANQRPPEPELRAAIDHYTVLRFSGQAPAPRVAAFRHSLRALR